MAISNKIEALTLPDAFKMGSLQVPKRSAAVFVKSGVNTNHSEMATPSISFGRKPGPGHVDMPCEVPLVVREVSGSYISLLYVNVALLMGIGSLVAPDRARELLWVLSPLWTTAILANACAGKDGAALICGVILVAAFPVLALVEDLGLAACYIVLFAFFVSKGIWTEQRGVGLILCACLWIGVLGGAGALVVFKTTECFQASAGCALSLAVVCTQKLGVFKYKIVRPV